MSGMSHRGGRTGAGMIVEPAVGGGRRRIQESHGAPLAGVCGENHRVVETEREGGQGREGRARWQGRG